jgi:hypothetical protein
LRDEVCNHFFGGVGAELDEDAGGELVEDLLRGPGFVVGGEAGGGEGVDFGAFAESGAVAFDDAALGEGGFDDAPDAVVGGRGRVGDGGPVHDLVQAGDGEAAAEGLGLLVEAVVAAAALVGCGRDGGAGQRKDLHR